MGTKGKTTAWDEMCEERKKKKKIGEDDKEVSRILYLRVRMQTIRDVYLP